MEFLQVLCLLLTILTSLGWLGQLVLNHRISIDRKLDKINHVLNEIQPWRFLKLVASGFFISIVGIILAFTASILILIYDFSFHQWFVKIIQLPISAKIVALFYWIFSTNEAIKSSNESVEYLMSGDSKDNSSKLANLRFLWMFIKVTGKLI
ncbi:MAG: hypothetical protein GY839_07685 [candidate division Zixibacteria bacterium]|nr:hypothetical protein [candidate division Zixibacteria bacterium]